MDEYLAHIGMPRRSGRYPWGSGDRPFQSAEKGKSRDQGQKGSPRHTPSSARKLAKERAASLEKARKAKAEKKEYEENKQKALAKGSAKDVLKYKDTLTPKEIQDALNRIDWEKKLSAAAAAESVNVWDKIGSYADKTAKLTNLASKGIEAWNTIAKVYNSFNDEKMPTIGGDNKKEDPVAKEKDRMIASRMAKNGNLDQVLRYAPQMSKSELGSALSRLMDNAVSSDEKTRLDAIKNAIIDFGPDKKVFSVIEDWSAEDIARYRARKERDKKDSD